jgi:8-oxo-dGTP diphosphatase
MLFDKDGHCLVATCVALDGGGRVLLRQRKAGSHQGGKWELPGGKMEVGETHVRAARRELYAEFGLSPYKDIGRSLDTVVNTYGDRSYKLHPVVLHVGYCGEELNTPEHDDYKWVQFDKVSELDTLPNTEEILSQLLVGYIR